MALFAALSCASPEPATKLDRAAAPEAAKQRVVRKRSLGPQQAQHLVLERQADGTLRQSCVRGRAAAEAQVNRAGHTEPASE